MDPKETPAENPIEVDPGGLHARPEVNYGSEPIPPSQPDPQTVPEPEREEPGPETEPGH
jgi:hypothetical protein